MTAATTGLTLPARAKLNLRLEVLGRQPSGLHNIRSLIADLDLADDVVITQSPGAFSVATEGATIPERENIAWLASQRLGADLSGLHVRIRKNIPMQAGLGGGSADAAATLRGLTELLARRGIIVPSQYVYDAARVGSDIAACLVSGFKIVEGTGELIRSLPLKPPPWGIVLLRPNIGVPTSEAYRLLDSARGLEAPVRAETDLLELCKAIDQVDFKRACALLYNDFQPVVELVFPAVADARARLKEAGAVATLLCGSGSCVAGFFETRALAGTAFAGLSLNDREWAVPTGIARG